MSEARLSEAEREALIEAIQDGDEVEYVERVLAERLGEERERIAQAIKAQQISPVLGDATASWNDACRMAARIATREG